MALIQFTKNHSDHSTDRGFQFEFFCDKCGNGYMTRFQQAPARYVRPFHNAKSEYADNSVTPAVFSISPYSLSSAKRSLFS